MMNNAASTNTDDPTDFVSWVTPCIGKYGYQVLGTLSTDMTLAVINANIALQTDQRKLERWLDKWL